MQGALNKGAPIRGLTGGLDTKTPPVNVALNASPDAENVLHHELGVSRRGGFTPLIRQQPKGAAVRNYGFHSRATESTVTPPTETDYLVVPGCLYAGHREVQDQLNEAGTIEFFFRADDLTKIHGGNGEPGSSPPYGPSPYHVVIRPILSKGPVKKTVDQTSAGPTASGTAMRWDTATPWGGGAGTHSMPYALYLEDANPAGGSASYLLRAYHSFFSVTTGNWAAVNITAGGQILQGVTYHVIFTWDDVAKVARLRVGKVTDALTVPSYQMTEFDYSIHTTITSTLGTPSPIQVFDIPQEYIVAPLAGTPTRPGGRNFTSLASGGWHFGVKRFEGVIDGITMHAGDQLASSTSALDRNQHYDKDDLPASVIQHWVSGVNDNLLEEVTGQGNHLYFVPRGPVYSEHDGAPTGASWWFNGATSYAMPRLGRNVNGKLGTDDGNPNWRYMAHGAVGTRIDAAMQVIQKNNEAHGLHVVCWPDSKYEPFEQVLAEIHSVIRLAIDTDGTFIGHVRDAQFQDSSSPAVKTHQYQTTTVKSNTVVEPGRRYAVTLIREEGGGTVSLYVNGVLDAQANPGSSNANGQPISGMTIGMGSYRFTCWTDDVPTAGSGNPHPEPSTTGVYGAGTGGNDDINVDHRSGFCGRLEEVAIVCGGSGVLLPKVYKDSDADDARVEQSALFDMPDPIGPPRTSLGPAALHDTVSTDLGAGAVIAAPGDVQLGVPLRYAIGDTTTNPNFYALAVTTSPTAHEIPQLTEGAHDELDARHIRTYYLLGRWIFDKDDRDLNDQGRYLNKVEYRNHTGTKEFNPHRGVHIQRSSVTDVMGALGVIDKRCIESDQLTEDDTNFTQRAYQHRQRPYATRHPSEIGPKWVEGLAWERTGKAPLSLLVDWEDEKMGERFLVTATARQLYWARQVWRESTPYPGEPGTRVPWGFGSEDSYISAPTSTLAQQLQADGTTRDLEYEFWVFPQDLDDDATLFYCGDLQDPSGVGAGNYAQINHWVFLRNGSLNVVGGMSDAGAVDAFFYREGFIRSSTTYIPTCHIKQHAWNHVILRISSAGVSAVVNGKSVSFISLSGTTATGWSPINTGPTYENVAWPLYIMGVPRRATRQVIRRYDSPQVIDATFEFPTFKGYMTGLVLRDTIGTTTAIPRSRPTSDGSVQRLLQMNEGSGWTLTDDSTNGDDAEVSLDELVLISEGRSFSNDRPYQAVSYRNALYVANGRGDPTAIRFRRFSHPKGPFDVRRLGMQRPYEGWGEDLVTLRGSTTYAIGSYDLYMAFVNEDGVESEPIPLLSAYSVGAAFASIYLDHLPRSFDPQVVARRLYISASGGGTALQAELLEDNETYDWETVPTTGGLAVEVGRRFPAPRGRQITVAQGSMWIANLTDAEAGQNAFQVSSAAEVAHWPAALIQLVDSKDGKRITSIEGDHGRAYLMKRDSIWQEILESQYGLPVPFNVNASIGLGGGVRSYDNVIYGAGDKGVHAFTGAEVDYRSMALEEDYRSLLDLTDDGLEAMFGAYYWPNSQYWLSVREQGRDSNRLIYVMQTDLATQIGQQPQNPWSRLRVPDHTVMGSMLDPNTREPILLLGSTSGQILRYDEDNLVDGAVATGTLAGPATAASSTSLTASAAAFDTNASGLKGAVVEITDSGGNVYERTIERNDGTTLYWNEPVSGLSGTPTFQIGAFDSYWSTPWVNPEGMGKFVHVEHIDLEYLPEALTSLTVYLTAATGTVQPSRAFPIAGADQFTESLSKGFVDEPIRALSRVRGRWIRMRFGAKAPLQPFLVTGWQMRLKPTGQRGGRDAQ